MTTLYIKTVAVSQMAREVGDKDIAAVCGRVLNALRRGWRKYGSDADADLVREFFREVIAA